MRIDWRGTKPVKVVQQINRPASPEIGRLMQRHEHRSKVLATLTNARCELEDALKHSIPVARYDPVLMPEPLHNKLSAMMNDLDSVLREIEGSQ
jgi:hypothetical protein